MVVPVHKAADECPGITQRSEALREHRPVFHGLEKRFRIGIITAHPGSEWDRVTSMTSKTVADPVDPQPGHAAPRRVLLDRRAGHVRSWHGVGRHDRVHPGPGLSCVGCRVAAAMGVGALGYWRGWLAAVPSFWFVYILTRPLGASFADWTAVSFDRGRLGLGTGPVSLGLAACVVAVVTYLSIAGNRNAANRFR